MSVPIIPPDLKVSPEVRRILEDMAASLAELEREMALVRVFLDLESASV